jgi:hypothetical protein
MIEINVSAGFPYYSQKNNKIRPLITCNTTSMIAALSYRKIVFPTDSLYPQPEDSLTNFILTDARIDFFYKKNFPIEYAKYITSNKNPKVAYPPNEIHAVLSYGTNLWLGKSQNEVTLFRQNTTIQEVLYETIKGKPVVQGGLWSNLHHITCIVGFATDQDNIKETLSPKNINLALIDHIIVDDPFGDFHTGYKVQRGNDIRISTEEYHKIITIQDSNIKMGHFFTI